MSLLSCYILTYNSEQYLEQVLKSVANVADDIVLLDSGSTDKTESIGQKYNARFIYRKFDNFKNQRNYAAEQCKHDYVLFVDSDEIINKEMQDEIAKLKANDFKVNGKVVDGISLKRDWFLFDQPVHAFYPVKSPDYPLRIFDKKMVSFKDASNLVHETPTGQTHEYTINNGSIDHYSCDSMNHLFGKLNQYTNLAAQDLLNKGKKASWLSAYTHGLSSWFKWYIQKGGYKDGQVGILLGFYAFLYTYLKYVKALFIKKI